MRIFRPLIVLTVLIVSLMTRANEVKAYTANGGGTLSCGSWTENRHSQNRGDTMHAVQGQQWVLGFLSGIGFVAQNDDDPLKNMDVQGVWAWIDNYCRDHPIDQIGTAASAFYYVHPR